MPVVFGFGFGASSRLTFTEVGISLVTSEVAVRNCGAAAKVALGSADGAGTAPYG